MDTFDVKEGKWALDHDIRTTKQGYQFPAGLMPKLPNFLDDITIVDRWKRGKPSTAERQYYLQTGRA